MISKALKCLGGWGSLQRSPYP